MGDFFHAHAHSGYSSGDALPTVPLMVSAVASMGQPGLALTDHGNMAGSIQLYKECRKHDILPFPGTELYVTHESKTTKRRHLTVVSYTTQGYENLVGLSTLSHQQFYYKPVIVYDQLLDMGRNGDLNGLVVLTGCFFGELQAGLREGEPAREYFEVLRQYVPVFVEFQNHRIEDDDHSDKTINAALWEWACEAGLPVIATQDSHYAFQDDKPRHEQLKRLGSWSDDPDSAVFPGDSFHLADEAWMEEHFEPEVWWGCERSYSWLLNNNAVRISELDNYSYNIPFAGEDPDQELRSRLTGSYSPPYAARLDEELAVLQDTGMSAYILLVAEVCEWMYQQGILFQTRGSASGSLVCYEVGITQVDPIKWSLMFERFMSRDRMKPPDIDLDVEDTRRGEVLEYLASRFSTAQIGTWATYSLHEDEHTKGGSLFQMFLTYLRKRGERQMPRDMAEARSRWPQEMTGLEALGLHGATKSYGTHAAGVLLTPGDEIGRLVPTMYVASSKTTVTQYPMKDVEALGLVKLDILGLRTLSTIRRTLVMIDKMGTDWIPLTDKATFTSIRRGDTVGVFQLEGRTMQRGCQEMQVRQISDLVAIQALYRPAVMSTGAKDTYLERRKDKSLRPERHPVIADATKDTYGMFIYQEQVMAALKSLGFTADELTDFLGAVKASNKNVDAAGKVIESYGKEVSARTGKLGVPQEDEEELWAAIRGFSEYGFNRAHATAYGLTAYYCAYLKQHYPAEFYTALLETTAGHPRQLDYMRAARERGMRIARPHVNTSGLSWTMESGGSVIRKGLLNIKGLGRVWAEQITRHAPYDSIDDLVRRTAGVRTIPGGRVWMRERTFSGVIKALEDAGALDGLE